MSTTTGQLLKCLTLSAMIVTTSVTAYKGYELLEQMVWAQTNAAYDPSLLPGSDPATAQTRQDLEQLSLTYQRIQSDAR